MRLRHRLLRDAVRAAAAAAACIAFVFPATAVAEVPVRSATAGQPFSYTGPAYSHFNPDSPQVWIDPDHDKCGGPSAAIHWGFPGDPPTNEPADASLVSVASGWQVVVSGTHTFQRGGGVATSSVDITITCDGELQFESYFPWVHVNVSGGNSCPFPRAGLARGWALAAQQLCQEPKRRFSPKEKRFLAIAKAYSNFKVLECAAITGISAFSPPTPITKTATAVGVGCGIFWGMQSIHIDWMLDTDPPDPHFKHIAKPSGRHLNRVRPSGQLSRRDARTLNRLLDGYSRAANLNQVFRVTIERASGATATLDPANVRYERMQMLQAADYAQKLARQLDRVRRLGGPAVRVLRRMGVNVRITRQRAAGFAAQVRHRGLPRRLAHILKRLGARRSDLRALKRAILGLPARRAAGQFPGVLAGHSASLALRAEARAMRLFAKRVRAHPTAEPGAP